mmetsp:Transcript_112409/g.155228  ORF Transcript_112409/g.155228 Transcript_112409/m.155228 type:complete len:93 (+) Transcript_112409:173-451(+)
MKFFSALGGTAGVSLATFYAYHAFPIEQSLLSYIASSSTLVFYSTQKIYLQEPRPYFIDSEISPYNCKTFDFGNPSGHSCMSAIVFLGIWIL